MGGNRQQKLAAKAVRRKQVVAARQQAERLASGPSARAVLATSGPVERCLRLDDMVGAGIGHVVLARSMPAGGLGCSFFIVDLLCLGVKDAFFREMTPSELDEWVTDLQGAGQRMVPIDPASAKKLVLDAVAFAAGCGMDPAKGYRVAVRLFDGIDAEAASETFAFGRDGKAVYVPGPHDSPSKMREIERRLIRARGDAWDVDLVSAMPERERFAFEGIIDIFGRKGARGGPVIEHDPGEGDPPLEDDAVKPSA